MGAWPNLRPVNATSQGLSKPVSVASKINYTDRVGFGNGKPKPQDGHKEQGDSNASRFPSLRGK